MNDLIIIGAGDFGRETIWVAERMNLIKPAWNILGFVDDGRVGEEIDGYPVLGGVERLCSYSKEIYVTCAIADGEIKERVWNRLSRNANIHAATLIDPSAIIGKGCAVGEGSIICAGTVLAIATRLGKNCIVNLNCTVGHDAILGDFCTVHPGSNISGKVVVGERCILGTGTKIIQGLHIAADTTLGAGAVVIKDIEESGTYVGVPAKKVK